MPSIRDQLSEIESTLQCIEGDYEDSDDNDFKSDMARLRVLLAQLGLMSLQTITRYDYWRAMYAEKAGMSESDFDTMTDECIRHGASPGDECLHLVVTAGGYCANCGVNCRGR